MSLEAYEKACVVRALRETDGDKMAAARLLKIGKSTLYRKIDKHGLRPPREREVTITPASHPDHEPIKEVPRPPKRGGPF